MKTSTSPWWYWSGPGGGEWERGVYCPVLPSNPLKGNTIGQPYDVITIQNGCAREIQKAKIGDIRIHFFLYAKIFFPFVIGRIEILTLFNIKFFFSTVEETTYLNEKIVTPETVFSPMIALTCTDNKIIGCWN